MTTTKKGPLSQKEKTYIEKNYHSKTVVEIANKLHRTEYMVDKFIKTLSFSIKDDEPKEEETPKQITGDLFAKNKERGVVVMTQTASMAGDESKSKRKEAANGISPRYTKNIHKIRD
jgi:hypothetical protein